MRSFQKDAGVGAGRSALRLLFTATAVCLWLTPAAYAATPEETGLEIAREARERDRGFGNYTAGQAIVLRNKRVKRTSSSNRSGSFLGKSAAMRWFDYNFGADLNRRDFSKTGLKRVG